MAKGRRHKQVKKKRGKPSFKSQAKLPRHAGQRTQFQRERNELRSDETLNKIRYGFRMCWKHAPREMERFKVGKVGSFAKDNHHAGVCWGWPSECNLTDSQARTIYYAIWKTRALTIDQMIVVRKSFSYAYELKNNLTGNYPGVKEVWKFVREAQLAPALRRVIPNKIPTVEELKVFAKPWTIDCGMSLIQYCSGLICAHDAFLFGLRSTEDVDRVKKSFQHDYDWQQGWCSTSFQGGRAKLCGVKAGTRPWKIYAVCFCNGKRHQRPPQGFKHEIQKNGNPIDPEDVTWTTHCPLSCLELLWSLQDKPRRYGKWLPSGRFGKSNIADPVKAGIDWMLAMGATSPENRYDHNSGRRCFARYTRKLGLEYPPIFQIIGDLEEVWRVYDPDLPKSGYDVREQSPDPKVCCYALRLFAKVILGLKKKIKPKLGVNARLNFALLKALKGKVAAWKALYNDDESSDESSSDEQD